MNSPTLHAHLQQVSRRQPEPLRVLVVHDGPPARRRVGQLLLRISRRLGAKVRLDCNFQRLQELAHRDAGTNAPLVELVFLAVSCSATLPMENLAGITSLLPALKANHGALVFLSGTRSPRERERMLIEQFLHTCTRRAGVAFFSGGLPGLGCPGCGTLRRNKAARSRAKRFCVLHAPRNAGAPPRSEKPTTNQKTP